MQNFIIILLGLWDEKIIFPKKKGIIKNKKLQESYCKDPFEGTVYNFVFAKDFPEGQEFQEEQN